MSKLDKQVRNSIRRAAVILASFIAPAILMLLWNFVMPDIFGLPEIGYVKALALSLISNILFKKPSLKD